LPIAATPLGREPHRDRVPLAGEGSGPGNDAALTGRKPSVDGRTVDDCQVDVRKVTRGS
jgi:hypothetical protein